MKKFTGAVLILMALIIIPFISACGRNAYQVTKMTESYKVDVQIDHNPPIAGENKVTVKIKDNTGKDVTDANVVVGYDMPAMPGMPAMSHKSDTTLEGDSYKGTIDLMMAGSWTISVNITRNGKTETAKFTIDAR
jgi:hypothetical protein